MSRDYRKLLSDYQTRFAGVSENAKLCQIFMEDYTAVLLIAEGLPGNVLFNAIDTALVAGIMIGLSEGKRLEAQNKRKKAKAQERR